MSNNIRLGVNIDHVATIRNARGGSHPSPVKAAILAQKFGADGVTIHLREDRRHIRDEDLAAIKGSISLPINLEMAATNEMLAIALKTKPNAVCIVPEKRQEVTTEGGLDVMKYFATLKPMIARLHDEGIRVSLFVDANGDQIRASRDVGADIVEIHTGEFCHLFEDLVTASQNGKESDEVIAQICEEVNEEFLLIEDCVKFACDLGLECHAGHGLNYETAGKIAQIKGIAELNIGHFLIGEAIFDGFENVIARMKGVISGG